MSISLLTGKKNERIHLFAIPWHIGQDTVKSVEVLLNAVKQWFNKIEVVMFDRGFHKNELIWWLEQNKVPYLIHMKKSKGAISKLLNKTKSFHRSIYTKKFSHKKTRLTMQTNLFICKNVGNKDWLFVSSIWFKNKWQVRNLYRNRWQIETNYAVSNQNRIMSKSTHYLIRYFYFLCDILLQVLWRVGGFCRRPFKVFLFILVVGIQQVVEMFPILATGPP